MPRRPRPGFEHPLTEFEQSDLARFRILTAIEFKQFQKDFADTDVDNDGTITVPEIAKMLEKQMTRKPTEDEINAVMKTFDVNSDGSISFEEYMNVVCGPGWCEDCPPEHETPRTYMIPVDGGDLSARVFHTVLKLMKIRESGNPEVNDKLIIYQVTNSELIEKLKLVDAFLPSVIQMRFEALVLADAPRSESNANEFEIRYVTEEQGTEGKYKKCSDMIRDYAGENADVVLLGAFGDASEAKEDFTVLGGITNLVPAGCKSICLMLKRDSLEWKAGRQKRWLVAIDGSDISHCAVVEACKFMNKGDYMQLVYVETAHGTPGKAIISKYDKYFIENKVKAACRCIKHNPQVSIADEILDLAETGSAFDEFGHVHIVVLGSLGLSTSEPVSGSTAYNEVQLAQREVETNGSVAHTVLNHAKFTNVMTVTVDALLSGHANAPAFKEWFDGDELAQSEGFAGRAGYV